MGVAGYRAGRVLACALWRVGRWAWSGRRKGQGPPRLDSIGCVPLCPTRGCVAGQGDRLAGAPQRSHRWHLAAGGGSPLPGGCSKEYAPRQARGGVRQRPGRGPRWRYIRYVSVGHTAPPAPDRRTAIIDNPPRGLPFFPGPAPQCTSGAASGECKAGWWGGAPRWPYHWGWSPRHRRGSARPLAVLGVVAGPWRHRPGTVAPQ